MQSQQQQILQPNTINSQQHSLSSHSSVQNQENDFDPDSPNQKFFNLADVKPLDLKSQWLGNTHEVLNKFQIKLEQLKVQKRKMSEGFKQFQQNQNRFKISSLRKINFNLDKKELYREFMKKSRKTIQKIHPSLVITILSFTEDNVFHALAKMRRVSQIFNLIYLNENVVKLFSQKDFGFVNIGRQLQQRWCQKYVNFCSTFLYYKQIKYTQMIPQNSTKQDLEQAINFINQVYKWSYNLKSLSFGYFHLLNKFMRQHRAVIALQALSFTQMPVVRKASIIAFSNYLAFNPESRKKQQITKTKYLKMIHLVQDEYYRDSLVLNSKVSNFLQEQYQYSFSVFIDTLKGMPMLQFSMQSIFDLIIFHSYNSLKSFLLKDVQLQHSRIQKHGVTLEFHQLFRNCQLSYFVGQRWETQNIQCHYMPTMRKDTFGHCFIYRGESYYIILVFSQQMQQSQEK